MAYTNISCKVFVEDLEAFAIVFRWTRLLKAARPIEDFGEGVEIDCLPSVRSSYSSPPSATALRIVDASHTVTAHLPLQLLDLFQTGILTARAKEIAEALLLALPAPAPVEELEEVFVVGCCL